MRPTPAPDSEPLEPSTPGRPKVLLVEDDDDLRAYLRTHLAPHYEFLEAARGDDGLRQVRAELPDAIVSDILMPGLDGYALCRAIKSDPETDFLPVILLTTKADARSKLEGLEGGADDYITKPFDPTELLLRIRNLLQARDRLRVRYADSVRGVSLRPTPLSLSSSDEAFCASVQDILDRESQKVRFDVAALASQSSMSRSQLHRRTKELFGLAPSELIMRFRLERAARMLAAGSGRSGEIGYAVGFCDVSHFVRRFREHYGQTPAAYAAAARGSGGAPSGGPA